MMLYRMLIVRLIRMYMSVMKRLMFMIVGRLRLRVVW